MKNTFFRRAVLAASLLLSLQACQKEIDELKQGVFVIANHSGLDVTLIVYNTSKRGQPPLRLAVGTGQQVERAETGDFGGFAYPELYFRGDSVVLAFADGKRVLHYCPQAQQLRNQCAPARNVLAISQYQEEPLGKNVSRYTFRLTPADYALAR
ncbi:hypothetical protein [Hymenobacter arizonensis]|uniref:Lipoprotein n=1 Tax=Hymenobacter arizonensis TaxID=1227077 RepID=A0A1I5UIJ2_HYMAR|nr:hypothetical protein [Hymenobacter arizonensis]SFP95050.1 hypothetical protein SAMN04515668_0939 [Hymenobacter arizonensis]